MEAVERGKLRVDFGQALSSSFLRLTRRRESSMGLYDLWVLDYLASLMERFVRTSALYTVNRIYGETDTVTHAIMRAIETGRDPFGHRTAEYALFATGALRTSLERQGLLPYYRDVGVSAYDHLMSISTCPEFVRLYGMLAGEFDLYSDVIRDAQDMHYHSISRKEGHLRSSPEPSQLVH